MLSSCNLLLRGGHVIDPANGLSAQADVAIDNGRILAVGANLSFSAQTVIDVSGLYVTPGLIDMHCHCYPTFPFAQDSLPTIHPDAHMFKNGVTTAVDAGTCGWMNFPSFYRNVITRSETRVLAFLNIADRGMVHMADEDDPSCFHAGIVSEVANAFSDVVVGIKTAHYWVNKPFDSRHTAWASVDSMLDAAEQCAKPCMADFQPSPYGRSYSELLLAHLRPGDIHTHMYAQQFPLFDENGRLRADIEAAHERGILFDLGHGAGSFWFRNAIPSLRQHHTPDSLSTDLYIDNASGPVIGLIHVMSKFLNMGMTLEELIRRVTANPASMLHHPELGTLSPGSCADVAVLHVQPRQVHFADSGRARMKGNAVLECMLTVRQGRIVYDPCALSMPDWETAPKAYWTSPGVLKPTDL